MSFSVSTSTSSREKNQDTNPDPLQLLESRGTLLPPTAQRWNCWRGSTHCTVKYSEELLLLFPCTHSLEVE